jgi:P-type Ca2+ transporter type 2C
VLFNWPLLFMPIHIAFLHLIIDPACSIVYEVEPAEADAMNRPPRDPKEPLFSKRVLLLSTLQGLSVLAMLLTIFGVCLARGQGELDARTLAFTTLIIANLGLMMTNRSWTSTIGKIHRAPNAALWWVTGGTAVFLGLVLTIPFLREIFRFSVIHPLDVVICVSAGLSSVVWFELFKLFTRKRG